MYLVPKLLHILGSFDDANREHSPGEEVTNSTTSYKDLLEEGFARFPLEYLSDRQGIIRNLTEGQWRQILYKCADKSRSRAKRQMLKIFEIEMEILSPAAQQGTALEEGVRGDGNESGPELAKRNQLGRQEFREQDAEPANGKTEAMRSSKFPGECANPSQAVQANL